MSNTADESKGVTLGQLGRRLDDFEAFLKEIGVGLVAASPARMEIDAAREMLKWASTRQFPPDSEDNRDTFQCGVAVNYFASLLLHRRNHPLLKKLLPHIRYLVPRGSINQVAPVPRSDGENRKLFELVYALAMLGVCDDIELDSPVKPKGKNPDIIARIRGKGWGIACKVVHSRDPGKLWENLRIGFDQIEKAQVDLGYVAVSVKNLFHQDQWFPMRRDELGRAVIGVKSDSAVQDEVKKELDNLVSLVRKHPALGLWENANSTKVALPMVALFAPVAAICIQDGYVAPTFCPTCMFAHVPAEGFRPFDQDYVEPIANKIHTVLLTGKASNE